MASKREELGRECAPAETLEKLVEEFKQADIKADKGAKAAAA